MILPTLLSARRRRCALAAIAVCLGSSIASVGPAQAVPATGAQVPVAAQAAAAKPAVEHSPTTPTRPRTRCRLRLNQPRRPRKSFPSGVTSRPTLISTSLLPPQDRSRSVTSNRMRPMYLPVR